MTIPIRVLLLEDRAEDAELVLHQLRRSGYDPAWSRVETEGDFIAHLDPAPDIILADYQMPQFNGLRALQLLGERGLDIPFIIVSGTIGEETAVEAMKQGASDYLMKDRLTRLTAAIEHALEQKRLRDDKRHAGQELRDSEERYRTLVENLNDIVFAVDTNGKLTYVSPVVERVLGYSVEELVGQHFRIIVHPDDLPVVQNAWARVTQGAPSPSEYRVLDKTGNVRWARTSSRPRFEGTHLAGMTGIMTDINERKHAQDALAASVAELRALFAAMTDVILVLDAEGRYLQIAPTNPSRLYKPPADLVGKTLHEVLPTAEADNILTAIRLALSEQRSIQIEYSLPIDGVETWFEGTVSPLSRDQVFWIARDVTERKKSEGKINEQLSHLSALHTIDLAVASSTNIQVILDLVLAHVKDQLHVDASDVLLMDLATNRLEYAADRGFMTRLIEESSLPLGRGIGGRVALERKTIYSPNLMKEAKSFARSRLVLKEGFVAYYGIPLIAKDKVRGVLEIFHRAPLKEDRDWMRLLEALATQAALAIDNAELFNHLERSRSELELSYDTTIEGWSRALDLRDKETEGHTQRVTDFSILLARHMGMSEAELVDMRRGALLHDIGKMGVPDAILHKPGPLTDDEWTIMRQHPALAFELLTPVPYLRHAIDIPHNHHEKWDGTGYPRGLKGEAIPLLARIFAIVDVWDALRSERPYREAWPETKVQQYLKEASGKHFDPKVVEAFLTLLNTLIPQAESDNRQLRTTGFPRRVFKV